MRVPCPIADTPDMTLTRPDGPTRTVAASKGPRPDPFRYTERPIPSNRPSAAAALCRAGKSSHRLILSAVSIHLGKSASSITTDGSALLASGRVYGMFSGCIKLRRRISSRPRLSRSAARSSSLSITKLP